MKTTYFMNFILTLSMMAGIIAFEYFLASGSDKFEVLPANEFQQKLQASGDYHLIDIRTPKEFEKGHIESAININYMSPAFGKKVGELEKGKPVFIYCYSGHRTPFAVKKIAQAGFEEIYDLEDGYSTWDKQGSN